MKYDPDSNEKLDIFFVLELDRAFENVPARDQYVKRWLNILPYSLLSTREVLILGRVASIRNSLHEYTIVGIYSISKKLQ